MVNFSKKCRTRLKKKSVIIVLSVIALLLVILAFALESKSSKKHVEAAAGASEEETQEQPEENASAEETTEAETESETNKEGSSLAEVTTETEKENETKLEAVSGKKKVYLTFDDGPSANTSKILDILDEYGVKATFFTICNTRPRDIESMNRIIESGNTIAIHSVSHEYSQIYASLDSFKEDVLGMQQYIYDHTGYETWFYRFPGGSSNKKAKCDIEECKNFLKEEGFTYFDWNVDSGDAKYNNVPKEEIVENVLSGVGDGGEYVVLMHDAAAKSTTVEALPGIIEGLKKRGYEILPITKDTRPVHH
ncbi:MAG: polysaccharide deacetylase [Lachnospira sp.]|nr:polysaccharide deacetylase [Lachnospira sp.]